MVEECSISRKTTAFRESRSCKAACLAVYPKRVVQTVNPHFEFATNTNCMGDGCKTKRRLDDPLLGLSQQESL
ncbi:hypothetical protein KIN20_024783 [Parelaphostrongylus tenuis]|uniref:Uncharacterized protein n=1 Tax=Parelaphostrongylus tenuis TaxID=148309 RepID=A0AAD5MYQ7_PARTN|nr:hypothetical protein KIN20_024783 [Parelaphostrongylus tenuis]